MRQAASAYMEPQAVKPDTISSLMDLSDQARTELQTRGYGTQVPQMEAPATPNMAAFDESSRRSQFAGLLRQAVGVVPPTISKGNFVRAGTPMNSPGDQSTAEWAANPWAREQQNIQNANQLHAFNNQYAQMKTLAANTDTKNSLDMARDTAIAAAYGGLMNRQVDLNTLVLANRLRHEGTMEKLATDRNARQQDAANRPSSAERNEYIHATGAKVAVQNIKNILEQDPSANDLLKGTQVTWGELRKNTSPQAQALIQQRKMALDHIGQMQRRMLMRGGGGAQSIASGLGMFGDDVPVDIGVLDQFLAQANTQRTAIQKGREGFDWSELDDEFLPQIHVPGSAALGGKGGAAAGIDEAMKRLGIK